MSAFDGGTDRSFSAASVAMKEAISSKYTSTFYVGEPGA